VWWMTGSSFRMHYAVNWQPPASDFSFVAVDGYNRDTDGNWQSPEYIFTAAHDYAESLGKPMFVGEIGTVESPGNPGWKPAWITDAASLLRSWEVDAILWCDADPFRPDTTGASLDAWVAAAHANGGGGGSGGDGTTFLANASGVPGGTDTTWFSGFTPGERVSIRLNKRSGLVLGSGVANPSGTAHGVDLRFPPTVHGGVHPLVAVGVTSGLTAQAKATISPAVPPSFTIAAGEEWTMHARGFRPGEQVTVTFPGGTPVSATTDNDGAATIAAVSPPEPAGGGYVQVSSPSNSFRVRFHTRATVTMRRLSSPQQTVHVALTGFGAGETVDVSVQGGGSLGTLTADASGSVAGTIALPGTFGPHVILFTGETSGVRRQHWVGMHPTLSLSSTLGTKGSTVTVTSGPGWDPGETLDLYVAGIQVGVATADDQGVVTGAVVVDRTRLGRLRIKVKDPVSGLRARAWFRET